MKVLMLAPLPPPTGGIASWTVRYKDYCEQNAISLRIVNIAMQGDRATREVMKLSLAVELKRTWDIIRNLKREINKDKSDVVHLNTSCSPLGVLRDALCVLSIHKRIPVVLHCHCNIGDQLGKGIIQRKAFSWIVKRSSAVIVLNKYSKQYVEEIEKEKAVIVPNFINETLLCEKHHIKDRIENAVYVGHIERAKGIVQLARAAEKLPEIKFTLVGAPREELSGIGLPTNLEFVGRVSADKVQEFLTKADIFVFPSYSEGFSNALLEAMALGLPVIATNVGANDEMIESKGGVIISENTGEKIVEAILSMEDPQIRKTMSEWNIQKVKTSYMIHEVVDQYFDIYNRVARG